MQNEGNKDNRPTAHLDEEEAILYLSGEISSTQREIIEAHLSSCDDCRIWLASLAKSTPLDREPSADTEAKHGSLDRYIIESQIGAGAMGVVFQAWDAVLDRQVALKISKSDQASEEEKSRMLAEARAMAKISHLNVVGVLDAGHLDDEFFVVMEYVEGQTLDIWLEANHTGNEAIDILRQIAAGIHSVHSAGIVHRDVKPSNIVVTQDGTAKLMDFGLAWHLIDGDESNPQPSKAGTPAYMAPELLEGVPASPQSDIYSFCKLVEEVEQSQSQIMSNRRMNEFLQAGRATDPNQRPATIEPFLVSMKEKRPTRRSGWLLALAAMVLVLSSVLWFATWRAEQDQACTTVDEAMSRVWDKEVQTKIANWVDSGTPEEANQLLKQAIWQYPEQYSTAIQSICNPETEGMASAFNSRIACLHSWVHQFEVTLDMLVQIQNSLRFKVLYELPIPLGCVRHEGLPTASLIEPELWQQGKEDRLALFDARKALLKMDTKKAMSIVNEVKKRHTKLPMQSIQAEAVEIQARASLKKKNFKEAQSIYDEALSIADKESDDRIRARIILGQIAILNDRRRPDESLALIRRYESLFESLHMPYWRGKFLYEHAEAWGIMREVAKGFSLMERSMKILREVLPVHEREYLNVLHAMGQMLSVLKRPEEGERLHLEGLAICQKHYGPKHEAVAGFEVALGFGALVQRKKSVALEHCRRALEIYLEADEPKLPSIAQARFYLCSALNLNKQRKEAVSVCRQAVADYEQVVGANNPAMAEVLATMGYAISEAGQLHEALAVLERALVLRQTKPQAAVDTAFIQAELALVLKRLKRDHKREMELITQAHQVFLQVDDQKEMVERIHKHWPALAPAKQEH